MMAGGLNRTFEDFSPQSSGGLNGTLPLRGVPESPVRSSDRRPRTQWPDERIDRLKSLYEKGLSYPLIAKELDTTKAVVTGKLSRLGLGREKEADRKPRPASTRPRRQPVAPITDARLVRIEALEKGECKWPVVQDPEGVWLFCGAVGQADSPYCAGHHRKGHVRAAPVELEELLGFR